MKSKTVVLDTNVWISFIIKSRLEELVELVVDHDITIMTSADLMDELERVLSRPKFARYLNLPISDYLDFHNNLTEAYQTQALFTQSPDPNDNFLFDLAIQSGALLIVTGDKRLLALTLLYEVRIISLSEFLNSI